MKKISEFSPCGGNFYSLSCKIGFDQCELRTSGGNPRPLKIFHSFSHISLTERGTVVGPEVESVPRTGDETQGFIVSISVSSKVILHTTMREGSRMEEEYVNRAFLIFTDEDSAQRVLNALQHEMDLCRRDRQEEPF